MASFNLLSSVSTFKYFFMSLRLGDTAPNFQATTSAGEIDFYEYLGNGWGILFSHPADYTPVCTTELGKTALLNEEFAKRNVKVLAVSVDPLDKHLGWINDINETQNCSVNFPIIADENRTVANLYGMIHPNASETFTVRSLFVIGPDKKVKLTLTYPASTGRNFVEVLRVIDSLQLTANHSVATPADWKHGEDVIVVPAVSTEDAIKKFPKGVKVVKPYLRYTPQPNVE
jgi:thioredoxin-dependent peroxiredoxin